MQGPDLLPSRRVVAKVGGGRRGAARLGFPQALAIPGVAGVARGNPGDDLAREVGVDSLVGETEEHP